MGKSASSIREGIIVRSQLIMVVNENSLFLKAASYIPLIGVVSSLAQQISLSEKIFRTTDATRLIELINLKNQSN